jgi:thymidylate synthase ThyX
MSDKTYVLLDDDGTLLDPGLQSLVLAKYSRSGLGARETLREIRASLKATPEDQVDAFYSKWVDGYGHSSIQELASFPLCFDHCSMVAAKELERLQRPGACEHSSRYMRLGLGTFVPPTDDPTMAERCRRVVAPLYKAYGDLAPEVFTHAAKQLGYDVSYTNTPQTLLERVVMAKAFDSLRYLLPAGQGTGVALEMNGRDAKVLLRQMLVHPLPELRKLGEEGLEAVRQVWPFLVREIAPDDFTLRHRVKNFHGLGMADLFENVQDSTTGTTATPVQVLTLVGGHPRTWQVENFVGRAAEFYGISPEEFRAWMNDRGPRVVPDVFRLVHLRALFYTDYGAYRDLQRHRPPTKFVGTLVPLGEKALPPDMDDAPQLQALFRQAYDAFEKAYAAECMLPNLSNLELQYLCPLATKVRYLFDMDLAEAYYMIELRTTPQGHLSYRRAMYDLYRLLKEIAPEAMQWCRAIDPNEVAGFHK